MAKYDIHIMESLPGVLDGIYSRGIGNKGHFSGTGYKGNIGEHGTIFDSWGTGKQA